MAGVQGREVGEVEVHAIPCKTSYTGAAKVSSFFKYDVNEPVKEGANKEELIASFRGRTLRGACMELPSGYSGEGASSVGSIDTDDDIEGSLEVEGSFPKLTYWNHDLPASSADEIPRVMEWTSLSAVLHSARP
ncbi:hypothetical protein GUITHDRAFT_72342 [Guillardia theta CCMP2712]|uniref:Uncharacterized protein n=1 Tax=Guillardia theta (strain CCMP2712) TaxID=905079 RepID=L1J778_GUITC|nr:hypothetical protein GUITHDRAFT_72342 [Guillardia theta CCMP2712]EKX44366.1 hypothetical protein GUITHDRAFT_72342 [Guillardia theta CCMP2712]|eukprot:XP_005831346.1 hypothetical protein GUITHDRAFT_72342 [Guillardia theta CCMP2712]